MRARIARCLTWFLAAVVVSLLDILNWIDPPYGTHAKAPGGSSAGRAAPDARPPSSARGPLSRPSPSPLGGWPGQLSPEADRITRPMILELLATRPESPPPEWDVSVEALRQLHRALLAA